jgi:hypothetical protein
MAATTISGYSDEITLNRPPLYAPLPPDREHGRVRTCTFRLTLASQASGTSFAVVKIPKGARIIGGTLAASATLANSATLAVGLAATDGLGYIDDAVSGGPGYKPDGSAVTVGTAVSDSTTCLKAAAAQGATQVTFAITQALGYLYKTAKENWLTLTTGTGTVSTEVVTGHVTYVVD